MVSESAAMAISSCLRTATRVVMRESGNRAVERSRARGGPLIQRGRASSGADGALRRPSPETQRTQIIRRRKSAGREACSPAADAPASRPATRAPRMPPRSTPRAPAGRGSATPPAAPAADRRAARGRASAWTSFSPGRVDRHRDVQVGRRRQPQRLLQVDLARRRGEQVGAAHHVRSRAGPRRRRRPRAGRRRARPRAARRSRRPRVRGPARCAPCSRSTNATVAAPTRTRSERCRWRSFSRGIPSRQVPG